MCGIIGATGGDDVLDLLLDGLERLEYRGYDSAGVALQSDGGLWRARAATGTRSLEDLRKVVEDGPERGGGRHRPHPVGHPRPPHRGQRPSPSSTAPATSAVVHNGIIENWRELAARLRDEGHVFVSDTDTEVIAHLVEERDRRRGVAGRRRARHAARGAGRLRPGRHVRRPSPAPSWPGAGCRRSSSAWATATHGEGLLASDIPALLGRTRRFWVLDDDQVVELRPGSMRVTTLQGKEVEPTELHVDWDLEAAEKGGYPDFMGKEIHEQPRAIADTLLGRLLPDGTVGARRVAHHRRRAAPRSTRSSSWPAARATTPAWWPSTPSSAWPGCPPRSTSPRSSATATPCSTSAPWWWG